MIVLNKLILKNLHNFLICKNIKEKLNIIFEIYDYYSSNNEKFISQIGDLGNIQIPNDIIYPKDMKIEPLKAFKTQEITITNIIHSIAHIEYNAMTIYCDTLMRFLMISDPYLFFNNEETRLNFSLDILRILKDEVYHFSLLNEILNQNNIEYGDIVVHDKLWNNCIKTKDDLLARIVIISLVQEARGLDAGPKLISKLQSLQDKKSAKIIQTIVDDEVNHVKLGHKWFVNFCKHMKVENQKEKFKQICESYLSSPIVPPFNKQLRKKAGIPEDWYNNKI